ncbi:hypothetical protein KIL84_011486 [Mauremys mutica]|uniref:Uncharacterized protein n=1 Tax=Mauremys mutica TaxID=74926 RepID=A0A9D3XC54_9SAUR|nr:hypothetical protein KIL84_011486 [Mauremys mutica]
MDKCYLSACPKKALITGRYRISNSKSCQSGTSDEQQIKCEEKEKAEEEAKDSSLRLKKRSQSVDVTAPGYNPLAAEAQEAPQASKLIPVTNTAASEEEQNNTTNTQRRNPRRSELKRYYTIGELKAIIQFKCFN